jgi:histidinol-phosphate aminotransferase
MVTITPSYGMYEVAADVNNVKCIKVPLSADFHLDAAAVLDATDSNTKLIYLCSPNNPTGNLLEREEIFRLLKYFKGFVVVDEAYIDFASSPSLIRGLVSYPNLIVFQTLSKAWGGAGIRLGMAFASPWIIDILNKIKYPYNVSLIAQEYSLALLHREKRMEEQLAVILKERTRIEEVLRKLPFVGQLYPSDANFILVRVNDANDTYNYLLGRKVIVRNRHTVSLCDNCLRITIGTPEENDILIKALKEMKP